MTFHAGASALVVHVPKEGLLKFAAREHVIEAAEFDGVLEFDESGARPAKMVLKVPVAGLRVLDTEIEEEDRRKVHAQMVSERVLAGEAFPVITFESESITVENSTLWVVRGQLRVRGNSAPVEIFLGIEQYPNGRLRARGAVELKLADFGIEQVTAVGGMMRTGKSVEVRIDFIGNPAEPPRPVNLQG